MRFESLHETQEDEIKQMASSGGSSSIKREIRDLEVIDIAG